MAFLAYTRIGVRCKSELRRTDPLRSSRLGRRRVDSCLSSRDYAESTLTSPWIRRGSLRAEAFPLFGMASRRYPSHLNPHKTQHGPPERSMKKIAACLVCLSVFGVLQTASAQRTIDLDPNGFVPGLAPAGITDAVRTAFKGVMATRALHGDFCAVAVLPGPADSFDVRLGLFDVAAGDRLDVLVLELSTVIVSLMRRISAWRTPPHWSRHDWLEEMRALGQSAAWQALCDYDAARDVPLPAFIHVRVFASALTRYRQEWSYALRCVWPADEERASITEATPYPGVLHELLPHALAHLSEPERRLIQQLFCDGNTEAEIAQCLGISHQAVSKRKRAALERMRAQLVTEKKK